MQYEANVRVSYFAQDVIHEPPMDRGQGFPYLYKFLLQSNLVRVLAIHL